MLASAFPFDLGRDAAIRRAIHAWTQLHRQAQRQAEFCRLRGVLDEPERSLASRAIIERMTRCHEAIYQLRRELAEHVA